jgi:hypothetical protein
LSFIIIFTLMFYRLLIFILIITLEVSLWCLSIASNIEEAIQQRAVWFPVISSNIHNILLIDSQTCVSSNSGGTLYLAFILYKENNASKSLINLVNNIERLVWNILCVWTAKTEQLRLLWDNQNKLFRIKKKCSSSNR